MTPATLRRLAEQKTVESNALARDADLLRAQGSALHGLLDPLVSISRGVWAGPAARDFETQSSAQAQRINAVAADLQRIGTEMDLRSRQLRASAAELRVQAARVEMAAASTSAV